MEKTERIEDDVTARRPNDGKDEMNLAEFPLCAVAHRLSPDVKTLHFEDRTWDKSRNDWITRRLTITGSDAFGLPTERDDEVLLGLIQLTRQRGFAERKVLFTRHELIRLLGWRDTTRNYERVQASLNRWTGVTLYYNRAWWNKERKAWMSESFHVLDNVWLCHRGEPPPETGLPAKGAPQSAFVWNEVIFRSFTHGNLKSIDFEFFKSLKSAVAKRLYRFLDKRFWHSGRREFDLRELCCEHIGLSRNHDAANLKRQLLKGVSELEQRGFIKGAFAEERFKRVRAGQWTVAFEAANSLQSREGGSTVHSEMAERLMRRGVTADAANQLCQTFGEDRVQKHIAVFDWRCQRGETKTLRNRPGFLRRSIERDYEVPKSFSAKTTNNSPAPALTVKLAAVTPTSAEPNTADQQQERIDAFWSALSEQERLENETAALAKAKDFQRGLIQQGGRFGHAAKKVVLDSYALKKLREVQ